ncbi:hypothetical protein JCM8547_006266 [Rhodosporidiobolus lusitaniae]
MYSDAPQELTDLDYFTTEDIVDRLVGSVGEDELSGILKYLQILEDRKEGVSVNKEHSETGVTPLVAVCLKEQSRTSALIVRVLVRKGAKLSPPAPEWMDMRARGRWRWRKTCSRREVRRPASAGTDCLAYAVPSFSRANARASSSRLPASPPRAASEAKPDRKPSSSAYVDLTESRSPSPVPKIEDSDIAMLAGPSRLPSRARNGSSLAKQKRPRSRTPSVDRDRHRPRQHSPPRAPPSPQPQSRAHLRLENLPLAYTVLDLDSFFASLSVPGVLSSILQESKDGESLWALATFSSLAMAQQAYMLLLGKKIEGREVELKIYSSEGEPVEPFREVRPTGEGAGAGLYGGDGGGAGGRAANGAGDGAGGRAYQVGAPLPPQEALAPNGFGGAGGGGRFDDVPRFRGGAYSGGGGGFRYFPRPRVPILFTAAELAGRVYCGSLRFGITLDEVMDLFSRRAGVVARVLRVLNTPDGSHAFAFVQLPDAITAEHAFKTPHGTVHDGHLLQVDRVNEMNHKWLFSLMLRNLPSRWQYRDVSDFLISTIGSFAGLRVDRTYGSAELQVKVELRYRTEAKWAAQELHGLVVDERAIDATIDQTGVRLEMERELAYKRLMEQQNQPPVIDLTTSTSGAEGYNPHQYDRDYPTLGGGATPAGGTSRRAPPPPPPPPPAGAGTNGAGSPMGSVHGAGGGGGAQEEEEAYNPFAPSFMLGKR